MLFKNSVRTSKRTPHFTITKINWITLFKFKDRTRGTCELRNVTIREIMEVGKNILEVTEEKRLRWFGHVERMPGNRLPLKILEWEREKGEDPKKDGQME
jgi:hypothetical protein